MNSVVVAALALAVGMAIGAAAIRRSTRRYERERFIRGYVFSKPMLQSLKEHYASLEEADTFLVARALRTYFLLHVRAGDALVAMPSKVVDALWHDFILDTREYHAFCKRAFGSYFHHVPAAKMHAGAPKDLAMRRTWRLACLEENINPMSATRLPLLFAIDAKLRIPEGNTYTLPVAQKENAASCGGGCGGGGGGSSGDGGGCGGGCGGS